MTVRKLSDAIGQIVSIKPPVKAKLVGWDEGTNEITVVMKVRPTTSGKVEVIDYIASSEVGEGKPIAYPPKG